MGRRSGLGKGLGALLPESATPTAATDVGGLHELPIDQIRPNRFQPRSVFDEESLEGLTASIRVLGVLQPVLVRPNDDGLFELVAGERRWRAAQLAGLASIPAVVRSTDDGGSLEQALVENLHREDLNPLEEAAGYQQLIDEFSLTQDAVAERVGRSRSAVANTLRLLQLPPSIQRLLAERLLSAGHARALLALDDEEQQAALAQRIVDEGLSVRATEQILKQLVAAQYADEEEPAPQPGTTKPAPLLELERLLGDHLNTNVQVSMNGERGRLVVEFATLEDLERIYRAMTDGGAEPVAEVEADSDPEPSGM